MYNNLFNVILIYIILLYFWIYYYYIDINELFEDSENKTKNFVFSSVGDNTSFDSLWINDNMEYDVYIIYYGDNEDNFNKYKSKVKFIEKRKGSKFQNFKYFYDNYNDIINKYDRFFILDDDIILNVEDINNMFKISKQYNLDICGPSFLPESKISWKITTHKPNVILTYTNFVEVNVPLFSKTALDKFMNVLDYSLIGWGIDFLYIWVNGRDKKNAYAIIHSIHCINPRDNKKNSKRELNLIKDSEIRHTLWEKFAKKINCPIRFDLIEYDSII
jgi:hypothetical protein